MAIMPLDVLAAPPAALTETPRAPDRAVVAWLFGLAAMVFGMVVLGGATRLTGSGLSIMEWAPLAGTLPPLSHAAWERLFALYRQTDQYRLLHAGFGLAGFQHIFWLEWAHRLWGRATGLALLLPLAVLAFQGRVSRRLGARLAALFVLGGLQGAVGWFMVRSGFEADATAVAPVRLAAHLGLALLLYAVLLHTAMEQARPTRGVPAAGATRLAARVTLGLLAAAIIAGGLTAGLHAGLIDETFPRMDGHLVPPAWGVLHPWWRNAVANAEAAQFDHRAMATLAAVAALLTAGLGLRDRSTAPAGARAATLAVGLGVAVQYALGVVTLLSGVRLPLAIAHQAGAVLLLSATLWLLHALRPGRLSW